MVVSRHNPYVTRGLIPLTPLPDSQLRCIECSSTKR